MIIKSERSSKLQFLKGVAFDRVVNSHDKNDGKKKTNNKQILTEKPSLTQDIEQTEVKFKDDPLPKIPHMDNADVATSTLKTTDQARSKKLQPSFLQFNSSKKTDECGLHKSDEDLRTEKIASFHEKNNVLKYKKSEKLEISQDEHQPTHNKNQLPTDEKEHVTAQTDVTASADLKPDTEKPDTVATQMVHERHIHGRFSPSH